MVDAYPLIVWEGCLGARAKGIIILHAGDSPLIGGDVSPQIISIFLLVFLLYTVYFGVNHCLIRVVQTMYMIDYHRRVQKQ